MRGQVAFPISQFLGLRHQSMAWDMVMRTIERQSNPDSLPNFTMRYVQTYAVDCRDGILYVRWWDGLTDIDEPKQKYLDALRKDGWSIWINLAYILDWHIDKAREKKLAEDLEKARRARPWYKRMFDKIARK